MVNNWKNVWLGSLLLLFIHVGLIAQVAAPLTPMQEEAIKQVEDTLQVLSYGVIKDSLPEQRFGACRELIPALVRALKVENSFNYHFDRIKSVSIQYPQDSSFRIFTWQLYVDKDDYRYFGAIQMNTPDLQLFPLVDRSFEVENVEYTALSAEQWYGAIYYNLRELESPEGKYYLLFGFDGFEFFRKRKVLDILSFDQDGKPVFGAPIIPAANTPGAGAKHRLCLEYSAETSIRLNYDAALDLIIYDHLIPMGGQYGEGPVNVPDGSYVALESKEGRLVLVDKVWNEVSEDAPRPMPILDGKKKNILGKQ